MQQEFQREVRRNSAMSFDEVTSEAKALKTEMKMEPACISRVAVPN